MCVLGTKSKRIDEGTVRNGNSAFYLPVGVGLQSVSTLISFAYKNTPNRNMIQLRSPPTVALRISLTGLTFLHLLLLVVLGVTARVAELGTNDGYDVGGTKPICYVTSIPKDPNLPDTDGSNYTAIELLNDGMFGTDDNRIQNETIVSLLPSCYNGTTLNVFPVNLDTDRQLWTGRPHTFRMHLEADVSQIDEQIALQSLNGKSTIFFRLLLCDAIKQGFCRPLIDTREIDKTIKKSDTDLGANENEEFASDATRWMFKENTTLLGIEKDDDGLLVFSRWCRWTLRQITPEEPIFKTGVNITLQLPKGIRTGAYFFVGHTVMNFDLNHTILRVDVASAIPDNVVEVRDPPKIQTVTNAMKAGLFSAIGIFGTIAVGLFLAIIVHRNHAVMKLAQGSFLGAITGAACIQIICSVFFLPTRDINCKLQGPLVIVPMTFIASCLVGRIWRVYKVLSVMNRFARLDSTQQRKRCGNGDWLISLLYFIARLPLLFCNASKAPAVGRQNFRQAVSAQETLSLIVILTLPQIILQVLVAVLLDWKLVEQLDELGNIGRIVCDDSDDWAFNVGMGYAATVFMLAVIVAWISRTLPSAFNEKVQVFHAATICTLLAFMTMSLISITSDPTTHPDVQVFLRSLLSIGVAVCVVFLIVWPKVFRVLSGEKVVMSNYLATDRAISSVSMTAESQTHLGNSTIVDSNKEKSSSQQQDLSKEGKETYIGIGNGRISLKKDDPLPMSVASKIVGSESLLREVTDKFNEGRPLLSEELSLLQEEIGKLYNELNLIDFEEDECLPSSMSAC